MFFAKSRSRIITRLEGGVGAALASESKADATAAVTAAATTTTTATSANAPGVDKRSIFNAPGGSISTSQQQQQSQTQAQAQIPGQRTGQSGKLSIPPPPGTLLEAPASLPEPPVSPGRKRQRDDGEDVGGDDSARKRSPVPPSASVVAPAESESEEDDDDDDNDEMEMSDDD